LSQLLDGQLSHDAVTRFLSSNPKTSADLWRVVKPLARQVESDDSVEVYHKSLKQNASLEKSPTRTETTQRNHLYGSLCANIKLERLKLKRGINHFALKAKIYLSALQSAYAELVKLNPQS
jgi:hypothetical protein